MEFALRAARRAAAEVVGVPAQRSAAPPVALSVHAHERCAEMGVAADRVRVLVASPRQVRYRQPEGRHCVRSPDVPEVLAIVAFRAHSTVVVTVIWPHEFVR